MIYGFSLLLLLVLYCSPIAAYNFLVVNPIFGYSHAKFQGKLADVLADAGHNVTVLQPYHNVLKGTDKLVKNKNVEIMNYYPDNYEEMKNADTKTFAEFWDSAMMTNPALGSFVLPNVLSSEFEKEAIRMLKDQDLHKELRDKKFDAVLVETFETTGFYLAYIIDVNPIATFSAVRMTAGQDLFGQPSVLGYVPGAGSQMAPNAGFWDRLNDYYSDFFMQRTFVGIYETQHQKYVKAVGQFPHWKDLFRRSPILVTNANPILNFATPSPANIIEVGGITTTPNKEKKIDALPEEYEQILRERESTVLVSFGSVVRSFQMPENFKKGVIEMFHNLPDVTFIWKYERDDEELQKRLPKNVHLQKWVPQPALLADKRLKVFVTHGGLGSTMEVAYSGKPALMVPLFGDQPQNAQMLARHGGAIAYDKYELGNGAKLTKIMRDLVSSEKYKEHAEELRDVLNNQPISPKETFLKHVEFAVKFPHFKSQTPEISGSGLIAFYYLDVVAFFSISALILSYIFVKIAIQIIGKCLKKKSKNE